MSTVRSTQLPTHSTFFGDDVELRTENGDGVQKVTVRAAGAIRRVVFQSNVLSALVCKFLSHPQRTFLSIFHGDEVSPMNVVSCTSYDMDTRSMTTLPLKFLVVSSVACGVDGVYIFGERVPGSVVSRACGLRCGPQGNPFAACSDGWWMSSTLSVQPILSPFSEEERSLRCALLHETLLPGKSIRLVVTRTLHSGTLRLAEGCVCPGTDSMMWEWCSVPSLLALSDDTTAIIHFSLDDPSLLLLLVHDAQHALAHILRGTKPPSSSGWKLAPIAVFSSSCRPLIIQCLHPNVGIHPIIGIINYPRLSTANYPRSIGC